MTEFRTELDRLVRWLRWRRWVRLFAVMASAFLLTYALGRVAAWALILPPLVPVCAAMAAAALTLVSAYRRSPRPGSAEAALFAEAWGPSSGATPLVALGRTEAPIVRCATRTLAGINRAAVAPAFGTRLAGIFAASLLLFVSSLAVSRAVPVVETPVRDMQQADGGTRNNRATLDEFVPSLLAELRAAMLAVPEEDRRQAAERYLDLWKERSQAIVQAGAAVDAGRNAEGKDAQAVAHVADQQMQAEAALRKTGANLENFAARDPSRLDVDGLRRQTEELAAIVTRELAKADVARELAAAALRDPARILADMSAAEFIASDKARNPGESDMGTDGLLRLDPDAWKNVSVVVSPPRYSPREALVVERYLRTVNGKK